MDEIDSCSAVTLPQRLPLSHLDQLICIALARPALAQQLLVDPQAALDAVKDRIQLSAYEHQLLLSVQGAADLHDLAARLHDVIRQQHDQRMGG